MGTFSRELLLFLCPPNLLLAPSRSHHKTLLFNNLLFELQRQDYPRTYNVVQSKYDRITKRFLKGDLFA